MALLAELYWAWAISRHLYLCIEGSRRVDESESVPKIKGIYSTLAQFDDGRFRQEVRMTRRAFEHVLGCIAGSPVFANGSRHQQAPVEKQLHLALYRFGCDGNGASIGKVARHFGVSEGTVINYTDRVIAACSSGARAQLSAPPAESTAAQ